MMSDFEFGGTTSRDKGALFDETADRAVGIVEGAGSFVENERIGTAEDEGDSSCAGGRCRR